MSARCLISAALATQRLALVAALVPCFADSGYADLVTGNYSFGNVHRFDDYTGALVGSDINIDTFNSVAGVAVGPDGTIYVSSRATGHVLHFDGMTHEPLPATRENEAPGFFTSLGSAAGPMRFSPDGTRLLVSHFGGTTVRVFHPQTAQEFAPAATGLGPPGGFAFAPNGVLYAGNFGSASVIRYLNGMPDPVITPGTSPLQTPSSLLFLPNNDLLVVDMFGNQILRYTDEGDFLGVFATIEPVESGTNYPSDLIYDADGNLVLAVLGATNPPDNRGQLLRFDLQGNLLGAPLVDAHPPLSSVAWTKSVDAVAGDYSGDGTIGPEDFEKWKSDFGKWVAKGGGADGSGNGVVDAADYAIWRHALESSSGAGAIAVPEPATSAVTAIALLLVVGTKPARKT